MDRQKLEEVIVARERKRALKANRANLIQRMRGIDESQDKRSVAERKTPANRREEEILERLERLELWMSRLKM